MYRYPIEDFYYPGERVEDIGSYKPGGLHPVHIGDTFSTCLGSDKPRYRVLQKLGQGAFSTVWLAHDMSDNDRGVALKINMADRKWNEEINLLQALTPAAVGVSHPGQKHILQLLDHFQITGPNGIHDVLVTDVVLPRLAVQDCGVYDPKRTAYQSLLALDFLSQQGVVHGDLHTDNIAFTLPGLRNLSEKVWMETLEESPDMVPVIPRQFDGQNDSWPKYLVEPAEVVYIVKLLMKGHGMEKIDAVIIDFGSAFRASNPIPEYQSPPYFCAPEILLQAEHIKEQFYKPDWRFSGDIWSLGCSIYELVAGHPLFTQSKVELLESIIEFAGPLPQSWFALLDEKLRLRLENDEASLRAASEVYQQGVFQGPPGYPTRWKDEIGFASLVQSMLKMDPTTREPASCLIQNFWFDDIRGQTLRACESITASREREDSAN
ncbi:hypothetical protein GALMADRAFT_153564 [Galerina marginata CBS 339.88]|uniref:non-specific serine/threonine protein kinase n=1 Tax=Galerina marginata (strain CBS 339.88) TaxID=685588 RepID=A0A067TIQ6_GALM3|nr:hypothetical protein GALMADRAFT_153564 [Galerina marginata CBS 339.88]